VQALLDLRCDLQPASEQPVLRAGPDSTSTSDGSRYWSDWEDFVRVIHAIPTDIDAFLKRNGVDSRAKLDRATVDKRAMAYWTLIAALWVFFLLICWREPPPWHAVLLLKYYNVYI